MVATAAIMGCAGDPRVDLIGVRTASYVPLEEEVSSLTTLSQAVGGPVASVSYAVLPEMRVYLLRQAIGEPLDARDTLIEARRFPVTTALGAPREIALTDQDWQSSVTYDLGECSLFIPWVGVQALFNTGVVAVLEEDGRLGTGINVLPAGRALNVGPVLHRLSTYESADELRYNGVLNAPTGCELDAINLEFETRYEVTQTVVTAERDRLCGGMVAGSRGTDFSLRNLSAGAEVVEFCTGEAGVEEGFVGALRDTLPSAFAAVIEEQLATFSVFETGVLPPRACGCDRECGPTEPFAEPLRGPRSYCDDGFCNTRVEIDRVFVAVEGIVVVYAEDGDDPQRSIMPAVASALATRIPGLSLSCEPGRDPATAASATTLGRVPMSRVYDAPSVP